MRQHPLINLRDQMRAVDEALLALIEQRQNLASQIGAYKFFNGVNVLNPAVEDANRQHLLDLNDGAVCPALLTQVFDLLVDASIHRQYAIKRATTPAE